MSSWASVILHWVLRRLSCMSSERGFDDDDGGNDTKGDANEKGKNKGDVTIPESTLAVEIQVS
jgi:hypothetical protein